MCAIQTDYPADMIVKAQIDEILDLVRAVIPIGFEHNMDDQEWEGFDRAPDIPIIQQQLASARKQLGTLGGGK